MSVESASNRKRKRIVEHVISGFRTAPSAVTFGNTVEAIVADKIGQQKFRQYVGRPRSPLAITQDYLGDTVLKTTFLELESNDMAQFICSTMRHVAESHNEVHKASIHIDNETIRGKPQPQFLGKG